MTLIQEAKLAEKISDALSEFRNRNPRHGQDIKAAKAALDGLSWALVEIDRLLENDASQLDVIEKDLRLVHTSIVDTLDDVWTIIGRIGGGSQILYDDDFQKTWVEITKYCYSIGNLSLSARIDIYKRFILALCQVLCRKLPAREEFRELQHNIQSLGSTYNKGLIQGKDARGHDVELKPSKKLSYERKRGTGGQPPLSPTDSNDSKQFFRGPAAAVPSPPTSPTTTYSSISQMSSLDGEMHEHWARAVFADMSSTKLPLTDEPSRYHEEKDHPPSDIPDGRYDEVIVMSFLPDVRVSLHCRPSDMKARMMLGLPASRGRTGYTSLSLNKLQIRRSGCMLRFYHASRDGKTNVTWASLQFSTIERLILFACTFVAMRCQSGSPPKDPLMIWDDQYRDEVEAYRGKILSGTQRLSLFVYRDRQSRAIRLQVTKRTGTRAGTPVWTAFVTHLITSPTWCEAVEKNVVFLNELRPQIFKFRHQMEKAPSGAYVLEFESSSDARAFLKTVTDLRLSSS